MRTETIKWKEFNSKALNAKIKELNENPRIDKYKRIHPTTGDVINTLHDVRNGFKVDFTVQESKFKAGETYINWGRVYGNDIAVKQFLTDIEHKLYFQGGDKVEQLELNFA
jgi:hypothetical protein